MPFLTAYATHWELARSVRHAAHGEGLVLNHLPDGRVLSAGMDSKVCLWTASGARV